MKKQQFDLTNLSSKLTRQVVNQLVENANTAAEHRDHNPREIATGMAVSVGDVLGIDLNGALNIGSVLVDESLEVKRLNSATKLDEGAIWLSDARRSVIARALQQCPLGTGIYLAIEQLAEISNTEQVKNWLLNPSHPQKQRFDVWFQEAVIEASARLSANTYLGTEVFKYSKAFHQAVVMLDQLATESTNFTTPGAPASFETIQTLHSCITKLGTRADLEAVGFEEEALEELYEASRMFLRFNGVDLHRTNQAVDMMDACIEKIKQIRGGAEGDDVLHHGFSFLDLDSMRAVRGDILKVHTEVIDALAAIQVAVAVPSEEKAPHYRRAAEKLSAVHSMLMCSTVLGCFSSLPSNVAVVSTPVPLVSLNLSEEQPAKTSKDNVEPDSRAQSTASVIGFNVGDRVDATVDDQVVSAIVANVSKVKGVFLRTESSTHSVDERGAWLSWPQAKKCLKVTKPFQPGDKVYIGEGQFAGEKLSDSCLAWAQRADRFRANTEGSFLRMLARVLKEHPAIDNRES